VPVAGTYAYCLLPNHFHFLVRIKTEEEIQQTLRESETRRVSGSPRVSLNPSQQLGNLFNADAKAINNSYGRSGSLFQNPFGRVMVTSDAHFVHLISYIHRNPERHGFVKDYRDWPHTSYRALLSDQPTRLRREEVLEWLGGAAAFQQFHMQPVSGILLLELVPDEYD
jgi:putative transposase